MKQAYVREAKKTTGENECSILHSIIITINTDNKQK